MSKNPPFTTGQAAEYCHVSQATIVNWIKDGKLSGYTTPGGHYRIPRSDLVSFLKAHGMPVDTALKRRAQPSVLVLSENPLIRELVQALGKQNGFAVSLFASDYATSAEAVQSKPSAVVIDTETSSDPVGLCRWLSKTARDSALLLVDNGRGGQGEGVDGVDLRIAADNLAALEAKLEVLLS